MEVRIVDSMAETEHFVSKERRWVLGVERGGGGKTYL